MSNKLVKKIASVGLSVSTAVWLSGVAMIVPVASAQTVDLNALLLQIQQLQATIAQLQAAQGGAPSVSTACTFTRDLTVGSTGNDVKCLQQYLNAAGYPVAASGVGSKGNESTYFGNLTKAAVAKWQAANSVSPAAGYFGSISRAKYTALAGTVTPPSGGGAPVVVPASGVSVSVKPLTNLTITPSANNVEMMTFTIVSGENNVTVNGLTFKRSGAGNRTDFSKLYIYEGNTRLTSGRTVNSNQELTFTNLNIDLDKGDSVTLTLRATMASGAQSGNVHYFALEDVDAGSASVAGLPANSRQVTLSTATGGSLTIDQNGVADTTVQIGDENVEIYSGDYTSASEDVDLYRVILTQYGSVDVGELDNLVVKVDSSAVDADVSVKGDEITIVFDKPVFIEEGDTVTISLEADISAGAYIKGGAGTIELNVDEANDVYAVGRDFGYGVSVAGGTNGLGNPSGASFTVSLEAAELTFTYEGPQVGDIGLNAKNVVLFETKVAAAADYEVKNMSFRFNFGAVTELKNLKLVNKTTGKVLAGPDEISATSTTTDHNFDDVFVINAGVSTLQVVADIGSNTYATSTITVTLLIDTTVAADDLNAENLDTGEAVDITADVIPADSLAGKQLTVSKPNLTISASPIPTSQTYVIGKSGTVLGAFVLEANSVSDIDVRSLQFTITATSTNVFVGAGPQNLTGSLALYKGDPTQGTSGTLLGSKSVGSGNAPSVSYDTSSKLKVTKGGQTTVYLVADLKSDYITNTTSTATASTTLTAVTAKDKENKDPNFNGATSLTAVNGTSFTIASAGSFAAVAFSGSNPTRNKVIVPGDNILFAAYRLRPQNEDLQLRDIELHIGSSANASYFKNVQFWKGGTQYGGDKTITGATKVFDDINVKLTKDVDNAVELRADLVTTGFGTSLASGAELQLYISTSTTNFDIVGLDSGTSVTFPTSSIDTAAEGLRTYQVAAGYPTFTYTGANGTLVSGQQDLYKFTVTAVSGEVQLHHIKFDVTVSEASTTTGGDLQVGTFQLLRGTTVVANASSSGSSTVGASAASQTQEVGFDIDNVSDYTIGAGQTATFTVRGTVSNVANDDANSVSVTMSNDDESGTYSSGTTEAVTGDTSWSDTYRYFNGTYLEHPTTAQTLSL